MSNIIQRIAQHLLRLKADPADDELLGEKAMLRFGGRPHWGQMNYLTGSYGLIRSMYPKYDQWMSVFKQLNADGTFNNTFTDRCGFSGDQFVRE